MSEPEKTLRRKISGKDATGSGLSGAPTSVRLPSTFQQVRVGVDVVRGGDGIENEVEAVGVCRHLLGILGDDDFVRAEALRVRHLARRGGEEHDVRAEGLGELHAHVAETAEADDADLLAGADLPVAQRRIRGDARAQQRRGGGEIEVGRHAQHEILRHDDALGVTAEVGGLRCLSMRP